MGETAAVVSPVYPVDEAKVDPAQASVAPRAKEAGAVPGPDYAVLDATVDSINPVAEEAVYLAPLLAAVELTSAVVEVTPPIEAPVEASV